MNNFFIFSIYNIFNFKINKITFNFKKKHLFSTIEQFFNKNYFIYIYINNFHFLNNFKKFNYTFKFLKKQTFGEGFNYIKGLFLIFFIDGSITDDEPLWEPLEWSLVQTWIFFIFLFAWIAENLITSRYGSFTGRDKRVWFGWYKTYWLIELWYALCYGAACTFVIVPFYYELTYNVSFIFSWWNWYSRNFFFKIIFIYTILILIGSLLQLNIRWLNWKKNLILILIINLFIGYLLYINFIMSFFAYFTDPLWYQKTRMVDYIQLSHEPLKWGWGSSKRDHFSYHKVSTVFWFKNDGPFAGASLMLHLFYFLSIFLLSIYWITLLRKTYHTHEISYTFLTFCVSALRQFFYFIFLFYLLILISFVVNYWRFPIEALWIVNANSWILNFFDIIINYYNLFF